MTSQHSIQDSIKHRLDLNPPTQFNQLSNSNDSRVLDITVTFTSFFKDLQSNLNCSKCQPASLAWATAVSTKQATSATSPNPSFTSRTATRRARSIAIRTWIRVCPSSLIANLLMVVVVVVVGSVLTRMQRTTAPSPTSSLLVNSSLTPAIITMMILTLRRRSARRTLLSRYVSSLSE